MEGRRVRWLIFAVACLLPTTVGAHRLDEYLQATRVAIERDRVELEIDLTPGVSIASQVTGWIDINGDRAISSAESIAYGRQVVASMSLSLDGVPAPITLVNVEESTVSEMAEGVGTFRVRATADIHGASAQHHELSLVNSHHPESSVYLANALVPADKGIQIVAQRRSTDQHSLTIQYEVGATELRMRTTWMALALTVLGGTAWTRRRLGHSPRHSVRPI